MGEGTPTFPFTFSLPLPFPVYTRYADLNLLPQSRVIIRTSTISTLIHVLELNIHSPA